jgi:hypothetical protein
LLPANLLCTVRIYRLQSTGYTGYPADCRQFSAGSGITIKVSPAAADTLDEVTVQAEKSSMELSLDKKVFNVGKDLANAGGTAVDILTNVPSVAVDVEGNVSLRGSGNVRILIDGKPSGLVSIKGASGLAAVAGQHDRAGGNYN